ncbi:CNBP [Mytilus coruscus]|uniref:CNBP n=1 Tax=Mytilus coruscus TaxID=42192 RepID=A0A6J8B2Z3_MYTCO|nr:CNBP [Mytilus coruscus]
MLRFGNVIPSSVQRGYIKAHITEQNKLFDVRLFADNHRTECKYCKSSYHVWYACPQKPKLQQEQKQCYNCKQKGHIARDCKSQPTCSFCKHDGHNRSECEKFASEKAKHDFVPYAFEILEGHQLMQNEQNKSTCETSIEATNETLPSLNENETVAETGVKPSHTMHPTHINHLNI